MLFHSKILPSVPPDAISSSAGETAADPTPPACPLISAISLPSAALHSRSVVLAARNGAVPVAREGYGREGPACPESRSACCRVVRSQMMAALSPKLAEMSRLLSGEKANVPTTSS